MMNRMNKMNEIRVVEEGQATIVTHDGIFHGDDVMSVAICSFFGPQKVLRTTDESLVKKAADSGAIIADVGGVYNPTDRRFDHHFREFAEKRPDGTPYSSAGLLWREYGATICKGFDCLEGREEEASEIVDRILIHGIDAGDSGRKDPSGAWSIYSFLGSSNLTYRERMAPDPYALNAQVSDAERFTDACQLAQYMLWRAIEQACSIVYGRGQVETALRAAQKDGLKVVELPCFIEEWRETVIKSEASDILYGLYEDPLRKQWVLQCIPESLKEMNGQRLPLPEAWAGLSGNELEKVAGVKGAIFCSPYRFMVAAKTREGALALATAAAAE